MKESVPLPAEFDLTGDADLIIRASLDGEEPEPRHKPTKPEEKT